MFGYILQYQSPHFKNVGVNLGEKKVEIINFKIENYFFILEIKKIDKYGSEGIQIHFTWTFV